jgi:RNA-directed DNA polymerase
MSRGNRRIINGLVVTPQGNVTIGRKNKRYARKLLYLLSEERISEKERRYLQGYLGFMQSVEPGAINQFVLKYGASIVASAIDYRWTPNASESPASLIEVAPLQTTT